MRQLKVIKEFKEFREFREFRENSLNSLIPPNPLYRKGVWGIGNTLGLILPRKNKSPSQEGDLGGG